MKRLVYILFTCVCVTACTKCKKDKKPDEPGFSSPVNPDLYAYAYFKPGTYWVYQDSITEILDSVYVISSDSGTYTNTSNNNGQIKGIFHWFYCYMISSYDHYKYKNWMDQSYEVNGSVSTVNRVRIQMPNSGINGGTTINTAIISIGKSLGVSLDYVTYQFYYNTFLVKAHSYSATQKWFNYNSNCDDDQNTNYYITKNIGIVRREQLDSNRIWNLIRYHIVQ